MAINESTALQVWQSVQAGGLDEDSQRRAAALLNDYRQQQIDNGEAQWPTQAAQQMRARESVRSMFTGGLDSPAIPVRPLSADPKQSRAVYANGQFLAQSMGVPPEEIANRYEFYRNKYANDQWQTQGLDDVGFYNKAAQEIQRQQQVESAFILGRKAALRGDEFIPSWQDYNEQNTPEDALSKAWQAGFYKTQPEVSSYHDIADELLNAFAVKTGKEKQLKGHDDLLKREAAGGGGWSVDPNNLTPAQRESLSSMSANRVLDDVIGRLAEMKPGERKRVYDMLEAKAEASGYAPNSLFAQMNNRMSSGLTRLRNNLETQAGIVADLMGGAPSEGDSSGGDFIRDAADVSGVSADISKRQNLNRVQAEVRNRAAGIIDPFAPQHGWIPDIVEKGLVESPGAVFPMMAVTAGAGLLGGGSILTADFAEQNRIDLVNEGMDNDKAMAIGAAAAPLQAAAESLSNALQLGRFPAVQRALAGLTKPIAGSAGLASRYLMNAGVSLGTEYTEEQLQDNFIVPATQELLGALQQDVPSVDWSMYRNRAVESTPELLSVLAPMALVFGGTMTAAQVKLSAATISSQDMLEAAGYSAAQANAVRNEATPDAKIAKARELWGQRSGTPQSMEDAAKSLSERMKMLQTDTAAAQADLEQRGILPRMLRSADDKWRLTFNDGSTADFNSHAEADAARWQWTNDQLGKVHLATREALAQMERGADVGREFAVEFKPDARFATEQELQQPDFQARVKQGEVLDNPDATYSDAVAVAKAAGDESHAVQILGSSVNEFKDGVLRTTMRLYEGAHILTLVEEKLEGDAKAILSNQQGRDWMLQHLRAYEQASGDKLFAEQDDANVTDKMLVEAWSHIGQAYLVGKSTDKQTAQGKNVRRMFRYILNSGLSPEMNAETQYWRSVAVRAQKLGELKQSGKLGADVTAELEKQLGIDSQLAHEKGVAQIAEDMGNEALNGIDLSTAAPNVYSEENPGPNGETFSIKTSLPNLVSQWENKGVKSSVSEGRESITLHSLKVDEQNQRQGLGTAFMQDLINYADDVKKAVLLSPSIDFGASSVSRLKEFYKRFGFEENKGRTRNFKTRETMIRQGESTFSIGSGDYASRIAAAFSPFQRSPQLRLAIAQVAKARALKLGAEWIDKAALIRSSTDIDKEARMREALAYDTRMQEYLDGLTPEARQTLEQEPAGLTDDPLISAMLDYGKLMSRSTAKKLGKIEAKSGDYDSVPRLPASWYSKGQGIMPDQMAQAMHDAGLLKDAYPDTLWEELQKRIASHTKNKAEYNKAQESYKAAEKYARDASRAEADQWAESAKKKAGSPKVQRDMLKAALRTLDAILSAAPPEVRAKVGGYVKLAGLATDEAMLKEIERRIEKLNTELEKWLKKEGLAQVDKLLKKGRPSAESGKKAKGKDADLHHLFAAAEKASKMDSAAVAGELARLDSLIAGDTLTPEQETLATTERGLVEILGDLKHADSGRIFSAIDTLRSIYDGAWLKWKLAEIERKEWRAGMRHEFISDTGKTGIKPERDAADKSAVAMLGKIKGGFLSLSSFHEVLAYAFGSESDRVKSLVDAERNASGQYEDANQVIADDIEALFTDMAGSVLAGERLRFDMAQRTIKTNKGELSQLEAIQALLMWRQEDGRRHMEGQLDEAGKPVGKWHYNQAWIDEITAALTPEAKRLMSFIMQKYGAEWATLNPLYRARYGVNLPAHDNYAPITVTPAQTKAGEVVDPVTGSAMSSGSILTPGSLRTRSRSAVAEPEFRDALQTLLNHTRQLEYWKAYYDLATEANAILGNREVMNAVHAKAGKPAATALRNWVDAIAQGGFRDASANLEINKALSRMTGRAATVGLLGRFSTLLVQSAQLAAAAVKMPLGKYLVGMSKLLTGNLSYGDAINSKFIQRRYKSAPPIVRQAMQNLGSAKRPNQITSAVRSLGQILSGADALFTAGTYALLLDYHRGTGAALGLSGAELETHAHNEAERDTEQVAQPTRMATRSLAEITSTNPLAKITWAYASEARQKIALAAWAATKAKSEPAQFAKTMFLVFGVGGLMTQLLKNLWKEAKGDDDEKKWSAERLVMDALSSPLHGIPFIGALMNDGNMLSGASRLKSVDFKGDPIDIMRDVDTALSVLGMFNDTAAGVSALSHAGLDAAKVLENLTED